MRTLTGHTLTMSFAKYKVTERRFKISRKITSNSQMKGYKLTLNISIIYLTAA
jgi:hypothetical protein